MTTHFFRENSNDLLWEGRPAAVLRGERPRVDLTLPRETLAPHGITPSLGPAAHGNRSAERVWETRVQAKLNASSYPSVRRVRCRYEDGVLTLCGRMPSYYCVQMAISLAQATLGQGVRVRNCLEVAPVEHT